MEYLMNFNAAFGREYAGVYHSVWDAFVRRGYSDEFFAGDNLSTAGAIVFAEVCCANVRDCVVKLSDGISTAHVNPVEVIPAFKRETIRPFVRLFESFVRSVDVVAERAKCDAELLNSESLAAVFNRLNERWADCIRCAKVAYWAIVEEEESLTEPDWDVLMDVGGEEGKLLRAVCAARREEWEGSGRRVGGIPSPRKLTGEYKKRFKGSREMLAARGVAAAGDAGSKKGTAAKKRESELLVVSAQQKAMQNHVDSLELRVKDLERVVGELHRNSQQGKLF